MLLRVSRQHTRAACFPAVAALSLFLLACSKPSSQEAERGGRKVASATPSPAAPPSARSVAPVAASSDGPAIAKLPETPRELVAEWTRALNEADMPALERLYGERVVFYGSSLTRSAVLERKRKALAATPDFKQSVLGEPHFQAQGNLVRVGFRKRSGPAKAQNDVFATLVLRKGPHLVIQEETDAVTQKKMGPVVAPPSDCAEAVWQLVLTTSEAKRTFRQIEQNLKGLSADYRPGGMGPVPPDGTQSNAYDVAIGVNQPERFEAYAWFTIQPDGTMTISDMYHDLLDAPVFPSPESVADFKRLCPHPPR